MDKRETGAGKTIIVEHTLADPKNVLCDLLGFMASRCFVHYNRQLTVRGYLAAIIFFRKMFAGRESPMSHCMIAAVGNWTDQSHVISKEESTGWISAVVVTVITRPTGYS